MQGLTIISFIDTCSSLQSLEVLEDEDLTAQALLNDVVVELTESLSFAELGLKWIHPICMTSAVPRKFT